MSEKAIEIKNVRKVIATTGKKVSDLAIKNGQMLFIQDKQRIALDYNGKRVFYNEINVLKTEEERLNLAAPIDGCFYFVIETAVMWYFDTDWVASTSSPQEVLFIGTSLPELGIKSKLYVDTTQKNISIWNPERNEYEVIAEKIEPISDEEINKIFN